MITGKELASAYFSRLREINQRYGSVVLRRSRALPYKAARAMLLAGIAAGSDEVMDCTETYLRAEEVVGRRP